MILTIQFPVNAYIKKMNVKCWALVDLPLIFLPQSKNIDAKLSKLIVNIRPHDRSMFPYKYDHM